MRNKAQVHVFAALKEIRAALPFPLLGIDSDNGSEFINHELYRYCQDKRITFTRSRAYRKNDSCYVEQKNWSVVRRNVGYARYDTLNPVALKREIAGSQKRLYELVSLKESIRRREVQTPDLDDIYDESTNVSFDDILT